MNVGNANLLNAVTLIGMGFWGYKSSGSNTALIPVIFGVLTTNTVEQAMERSESTERNKGAEAARTALEMVSLLKQLHQANVRQSGFLR